MNTPTAQLEDKILCLSCDAVLENKQTHCPRCSATLRSRKKNPLIRTWAYLITAILLFFPANLLPITYSETLITSSQADTIFSSIIFLWQHGSYFVASIIFTASILTPLFKIAVLLFLLCYREIKKPPIWQTKLYHITHLIGRWSMIDVFVVALLTALIHGKLAQITPGLGIFAFAGVVIFTLFATESFDIRILWDNYRNEQRTTTKNH